MMFKEMEERLRPVGIHPDSATFLIAIWRDPR
jgi:hypothetical protein